MVLPPPLMVLPTSHHPKPGMSTPFWLLLLPLQLPQQIRPAATLPTHSIGPAPPAAPTGTWSHPFWQTGPLPGPAARPTSF